MEKKLRYVWVLVIAAVAGIVYWQVSWQAGLGEKVELNGGEVYYTEAVQQAKATELLQFLDSQGSLDGTRKTLQLDKGAEGQWLLKVVVNENAEGDIDTLMETMALELSANVFAGEPVEIQLCDEYLDPKRSLPALSRKPFSTLEGNGIELRYTGQVEKTEADKLLAYLLADTSHDGSRKSFQLDKSDDGRWLFAIVVKDGYDKNDEFAELLREYSVELSAQVFDGATVEMHMCDANLNILRVVK